MTSFAIRWNQHRTMWKSGSIENTDKAALRVHYNKMHPNQKHMEFAKAFSVDFIYQPNQKANLDYAESLWIYKADARINLNATILPKIM